MFETREEAWTALEAAERAVWGAVEALDAAAEAVKGTPWERESVRLYGDARTVRRLLEDVAGAIDTRIGEKGGFDA